MKKTIKEIDSSSSIESNCDYQCDKCANTSQCAACLVKHVKARYGDDDVTLE